ncbi:MAG: class I SAM-dependent methyltransferase [Planctomycetes bacterium]|nr:class I SAM-dependent methyltransferase [Planctomycetota bacterium]
MFHLRKVWWAGFWAIIVLGGWLVGHGGERKPDVQYVPTPPELVSEMLKTARVGKADIVYDLGCGDGRMVIAAVDKFGAKKGVGIDIDPERIKECNENVRKAGVADRVTFLEQDLYQTDFSEATVLALYLLPQLNVRLRPILFRQLRPGDRIVSHAFDMEEWKADKTVPVSCADEDERTFYYWVLPAGVAGTWQWTLPGAKGEQACQLRLRQCFQAVSGTVTVDGQQQPIADATLVGDRLTFGLVREAQGEKAGMSFSGRIIGDTLSGSVESQGGPAASKRDWTARRDRVNLVGAWGWTLDDKPATLRIRRQDGRFYATLAADNRQAPVVQFYAWGSGIYFIVTGSARQTYEGIVEGDRIVGTVSLDQGAAKDWTAQRAAK